MRILAATITPPHLANSGAVNAAKALTSALQEYCEIDFAIMAYENKVSRLGKGKKIELKSRNVLHFTTGMLPDRFRTLFYSSDMSSLIHSRKYDLIHIHNPIPALEMKRVAKTCINLNIPYVVSTHGFVEVMSGGIAYELKHFYEKLAWKFLIENPFRYVIDNARFVFALSPFDIPILKSLRVFENRIGIVTNGVSKEYFRKPTQAAIRSVCNKFSLPYPKSESIPICFFVGNHTKNKGIEILLEAFTSITSPFRLIIGGKNRPGIAYRSYKPQDKIRQQIVFTDSLTNDEIRCLLHYVDLFVFPTKADTLPLVILEAMACGVPILSTKVGGIPYQIDEKCGLLVEANNSVEIRRGFETLTKDREKLRSMGESAKNKVITRFDWHKSAEKAYHYYQHILS